MKAAAIIFVLVHSPLVGPMTWTSVAKDLRASGQAAVVPALRSPKHIEGAYWERHAVAVVESLKALPPEAPVILVGHSGAGPLLPALASKLTRHGSSHELRRADRGGQLSVAGPPKPNLN